MACHLGSREKANGELPAGRYLVGYGSYHYGEAEPLYAAMMRYAGENGLAVTGLACEEYLLDEVTAVKPHDFRVKISIMLT